MKLTKVCFMFGHLVSSNGVSRSVVAIANLLVETYNIEVTLYPLYKIEAEILSSLNKKVKVKKCFGFYFRGFDKIIDLIPKLLLYKLFVREKHDIEISFQYGNATKIIAASSNKQSTKLCWMHAYDDGLVLRKYYNKFEKVVCVSKCNADRLSIEMPEVNVSYAYNPINDEIIRTLASESISIKRKDTPLFISVGRHSPEKGYKRLLSIINKLKKMNYKFEVWLVGDGPIHDDLVSYSKELGLDDFVKFLGDQKNPHKYTIMADLFICSSYSEGYSTACTEAIMLGIPVLSTDVSGAKEIIEAASAGLVTNMNDDSLFLGLKEILDKPDLLSNWKNTINETRSNFSLRARANKLFKILEIE